MVRPIGYTFHRIEKCNMCGSPINDHKILGRRLNRSQGRDPDKKRGVTITICKCRACRLIYSDPQPVPLDIQDHYGVPPENYWKPEYFQVDRNYFQHEIDRLKQLIQTKDQLRTLDIGAGLGKQMIALSNAGFDAYGLEPSRSFRDKAIEQMNIDPARLKLGMIEDVDYPSDHFDFISFGAVLEHLYDPSASIAKAAKWLRSNGIIHIEVPSSDWLVNKLINIYYKCSRMGFVGNLSPMHPPYHLYEFSLKSFEENGRTNNYHVEFYEYYTCETYLPKILDPILKAYMSRTNTGMQLCVWLRKP